VPIGNCRTDEARSRSKIGSASYRPDDDAAAEKYRKSIESPAKSDGRKEKRQRMRARHRRIKKCRCLSGRNSENETVRECGRQFFRRFAFDEGQLVKGGSHFPVASVLSIHSSASSYYSSGLSFTSSSFWLFSCAVQAWRSISAVIFSFSRLRAVRRGVGK